MSQNQLVFFEEGCPPQDSHLRILVNPKSPLNSFYNYVGNEVAVRRLCRIAFSALKDKNHICKANIAILGPASTGKTTVAKKFAGLLDLPFVPIDPKSITQVNDILVSVGKVLKATVNLTGQTLEIEITGKKLILPPCIIFIDEVHLLKNNIVQGLLKATEIDDRTMCTEEGWEVDTKNVTWIIATTERGLLFDAFDTRFNKIQLNLYSLDEMTQIVKSKFPKWDDATCKMIAKFGGRVPREVIDFAKEVILEKDMNGDSWIESIDIIRQDREIDEFGMTKQRLKILAELGQGPISKNRLSNTAGCKEEELAKFVMPPLLADVSDQKPLVSIMSRGYVITEAGLNELDKRNIPHKGKEAFGKV
jgi:Holliday junction resolvasome RuvABC ATP-dependent DNA helicase subunit